MASDTVCLQRRGALFVVSGPSGAGKTSISLPAIERLGGIRLSVSVTTRRPRTGERDGIDYTFVSEDEFAALAAANGFAESAEVHGFHYGTPRSAIEEAESAGIDLLLDIDVQGAAQLRRGFPQAVLIFLLPPSRERLLERLSARGTDSEPTMQRRSEAAVAEITELANYDYVIVNESLDRAVDAFVGIVSSERRRVRLLRPECVARVAQAFKGKPG